MALWRAGPERAYVALPVPGNPNERITNYYKEGDIFELPDDMLPSRTWRPKDEKALAICKRLAAKHIKTQPEPPDDPDDPKQVAKYNRLSAKYAMEQDAQRTWFGPDPYDAPQVNPMQPVSLTEMARAQGKSVRVSDQAI